MKSKSIERRDFLKLGLSASTLIFHHLACSISQKKNKPNILFIFTDDQRFDTIHTLGNETIHTPNLDSLVQSGTTFTQAHIMGGTAPAVCIPSRAMVMTGRSLFHLKGYGNIIPTEHITLPETFRKNGYTTFHIGKWHQDKATLVRSFSRATRIFGFAAGDWLKDVNPESGGHWNMPLHDFDSTGAYTADKRYIVGRINTPADITFENPSEKRIHSSTLFSDTAINFLRTYKEEKPFFMYLAYTAPHDPRQSPREYRDMYAPQSIPLPKNFMPMHPFDNGEMKVRDEALEKWPRSPEAIQKHIAEYYAIITHLDAQIGRVLNVLKETGLDQNTIIVFSCDNGLAVGQHGLLGKQNVYEHSVHVPLIIGGPGIPKNETRDTLCYLLDIFPTLCDLIEIPVPESVEGMSLVPSIRDPKSKIRQYLHFAYRDFQRGVRDERHKLIEYVVDGKRTTQFFDLQQDPWEINNLVNDSFCAEHISRLRNELLKWKTEMGDTSSFWNNFNGGK